MLPIRGAGSAGVNCRATRAQLFQRGAQDCGSAGVGAQG